MKKYIQTHKNIIKAGIMLIVFCFIFFASAPSYALATNNVDATTQGEIDAEPDNDDEFNLSISSNAGSTNLESTLQMLLILTALSLAPSLLIMVTCFTRIVVVLHFVRQALGTQTTPPNQVLVGLALFMTLAIMSPVITQVNEDAVQPFMSGQLSQDDAIDAGIAPLKTFMLKQTREKDLKLFMDINGQESVEDVEEISIISVIPAFIISELRTAFIIGFLIYLPFIVMDMVVFLMEANFII